MEIEPRLPTLGRSARRGDGRCRRRWPEAKRRASRTGCPRSGRIGGQLALRSGPLAWNRTKSCRLSIGGSAVKLRAEKWRRAEVLRPNRSGRSICFRNSVRASADSLSVGLRGGNCTRVVPLRRRRPDLLGHAERSGRPGRICTGTVPRSKRGELSVADGPEEKLAPPPGLAPGTQPPHGCAMLSFATAGKTKTGQEDGSRTRSRAVTARCAGWLHHAPENWQPRGEALRSPA